jgi:hypothetical protein
MNKKKNMRIKTFFPIALLLLSGCSASRISFDILVPAPNEVPGEIKTIAIIDRSLPSEAKVNLIEGLLTGEGLAQDKLSTQMVINGLDKRLQGSTRFNVIRTNEAMIGSGTGFTFPEPLPWSVINDLCEKYDADAIVSLETYDSDFIVTNGTRPGKNFVEFYARGVAKIDCGFRMYYPATNSIVDEFHYSHSRNWDVGGLSVLNAVNTLLSKDAAIREASYDAGLVYAQRVTPTWYMVSREYFKKSKGNYDLEEGARMMQLNDWDKAISALVKATENGHRKSRGKAAHNLAVVYEILGDLPVAKEWTTVAWGRYKEKASREYGYLLTRRMQDENILERQLND